MDQYDRRRVSAPRWMERFTCIAGDCPETCCQQWNIDVDPVHAGRYAQLEDPELRAVIDHLLYKFRFRRQGMREPELQYRLLLLSQPGKRCPLLNESSECRLQKKYGAGMLCDTCYFHPRTFWQIDEQTNLSACLSCPECARLALLHPEPTVFTQFECEIDPNAEWLETSLIPDPGSRMLLQNRETLIRLLCSILQDRRFSAGERVSLAETFLTELAKAEHPLPEVIHDVFKKVSAEPVFAEKPESPAELMRQYLEIVDPIGENLEKPVQSAAELSRALAGGKAGFADLLAENFEAGSGIMEPFLRENGYLTENFLVHCVFSDSFRQFFRYQNEPLTAGEILLHEASLLRIWYLLLRVQLAQTALSHQTMTEDLFLRSVIRLDKTYWHYPDWFSRCADRAVSFRKEADRPL